MKNSLIQQEIILLTNASCYKFRLREKTYFPAIPAPSYPRQFAKACWNGLVDHLLSPIMEKPSAAEKLPLMYTRPGKSILKIELSTSSAVLESQYSIDPVFFLPTISGN